MYFRRDCNWQLVASCYVVFLFFFRRVKNISGENEFSQNQPSRSATRTPAVGITSVHRRLVSLIRSADLVVLVSTFLLSSISGFRSAFGDLGLHGCPWSAVGCSAPFSSSLSFIFPVTSRYVSILSRPFLPLTRST